MSDIHDILQLLRIRFHRHLRAKHPLPHNPLLHHRHKRRTFKNALHRRSREKQENRKRISIKHSTKIADLTEPERQQSQHPKLAIALPERQPQLFHFLALVGVLPRLAQRPAAIAFEKLPSG